MSILDNNRNWKKPRDMIDFKKKRLRLMKIKADIEFLSLCKNLELIPRFIRINNKFVFRQSAKRCLKFENETLNLYIRNKHAMANILEKECLRDLYNLFEKYHYIMVNDLLTKLEVMKEGHTKNIEKRHANKISSLSRENKVKINKENKIPFINTSNRVLTDREKNILELGPKHVFTKKPNFKVLIPQLETILNKVNSENREIVRANLAVNIQKHMKKANVTSTEIADLIELRKDENIAIVQTDKSSKIAIMNKVDYVEKLNKCITDSKCVLKRKNPIDALSKKADNLIKEEKWPDNVKDILRVSYAPTIPKLFGRLKDHKKGHPIRPIVSKCTGPLYYIEKALKVILDDILPDSEHAITSTEQFINIIKDMNINENEVLGSLDVTSLFPSIDTMKIEKVIHERLDNSDMQPDVIDITKRALALVLRSNYLEFDGKIYLQNKGAPMGSPLSSTLAEFTLRPLEIEINKRYNNEIIKWVRFVDDIFLIWKGKDIFEEFVETINKLDDDIKFTYEMEDENKTLNYLDVKVINDGGVIKRDVYRKPMATGCIIPANAAAPGNHKMASFRSMINRMYRVCTDEFINKEKGRIIKIANKNGYKTEVILKLCRNIEKKLETRNTENRERDSREFAGVVEYTEGMTEGILNILKKENIRIGIKTNMKLMNIVRKDREKTNKEDKNGVYKIPFTREDGSVSCYIGMTRRKLKSRIDEHKRDIRLNRCTTTMARMNQIENIDIDFENTEIIAPFDGINRTYMRETIEIIHGNHGQCNKDASWHLSKLWNTFLRKCRNNES